MELPTHAAPSPLVLVVDDAPDTRAPLVSLLQRRGYRAMEASHGHEALELLRANRDTALVVLDLYMPTLDGWAFREQQLRDSTIAHVPVVVLSVAARTELVRYPLRARAVLHKPLVSLDDVVAAVAECCARDEPAPPPPASNPKWAAAFLTGRAKAFNRANVSYAALLTAIRIAQRHRVPAETIDGILALHNLVWDAANGLVKKARE